MSTLLRASWLWRSLAITLVVYIVVYIFLTPLGGLETRAPSHLRPIGLATLGLLVVGVVLAIASLVLMFRTPGRRMRIAALAAVLYYPAFLADQSGLFSDFRPPAAMFWLEWFAALVAAVTIVLAFRSGPRRPAIDRPVA